MIKYLKNEKFSMSKGTKKGQSFKKSDCPFGQELLEFPYLVGLLPIRPMRPARVKTWARFPSARRDR